MTAFALVCRASMVAPRTGSESRMERGLWEYETSPSHGAKSLNPGWCHVWRCTGQFVACVRLVYQMGTPSTHCRGDGEAR